VYKPVFLCLTDCFNTFYLIYFYNNRIGYNPWLKERIQQKAEEAAADIKEKMEKKDKKTTSRKKATKATDRQKIVWKVFNDSFNEVDCFPYQEMVKAYTRAVELTRRKNKNYFVNEVSVPMVEE
jgi:hypothetical protein